MIAETASVADSNMSTLLNKRRYKDATECVVADYSKDQHNASSFPIYQTATFKQESATGSGIYDYSRSGNPTRTVLESHLAKLMNCEQAYVTTSGLSALDVIIRLISHGKEIITGDDLYGGTNRLLAHYHYKTHHVDTTTLDHVKLKLNSNTGMVLLESPTNPMMKIADIRSIYKLVKDFNPEILVVVDNTMLSPILSKPLGWGCDIEFHSGTKFLSGHHDLMAGVIGTNEKSIASRIYFIINAAGVGLSPFDSFLLHRGVKTLSLRMEKQQQNAIQIANFLESRGLRVRFPGLKSHPSFDLFNTMSKGPGAVIAFETGSVEKSEMIVNACQLWGISVSFGCVHSLISMPCNMSHASIPIEVRKARELPEDLIRLCVGIEDVEDLISDLEAALVCAK